MCSTVFPCPCFLRGAGGPGCSDGLILHIHTYFSHFLKCQSFSSVDYFRLHSLLQIYCLAEKLQIKFQKERTILQNKRKMLLHRLVYCLQQPLHKGKCDSLEQRLWVVISKCQQIWWTLLVNSTSEPFPTLSRLLSSCCHVLLKIRRSFQSCVAEKEKKLSVWLCSYWALCRQCWNHGVHLDVNVAILKKWFMKVLPLVLNTFFFPFLFYYNFFYKF